MATFGETINLQPYILNWLVNGENSTLAYRGVTSVKATGTNFKKVTYEGRYKDFLNTFLLPTSLTTDVYPDRKPYFIKIGKGKLLKSLIEYKRRWNINKDSVKIRIDYVGFRGDMLVVKTTEHVLAPITTFTFAPVTGAVDVATTPDLTVTFPENMVFNPEGTYNVVIYKYSDDSVVDTYVIDEEGSNTDGALSIVDNVFHISVGVTLDLATQYYVLVDTNALLNYYESTYWSGISDKDTWEFTTVAV